MYKKVCVWTVSDFRFHQLPLMFCGSGLKNRFLYTLCKHLFSYQGMYKICIRSCYISMVSQDKLNMIFDILCPITQHRYNMKLKNLYKSTLRFIQFIAKIYFSKFSIALTFISNHNHFITQYVSISKS